jgi:hypothetical protein
MTYRWDISHADPPPQFTPDQCALVHTEWEAENHYGPSDTVSNPCICQESNTDTPVRYQSLHSQYMSGYLSRYSYGLNGRGLISNKEGNKILLSLHRPDRLWAQPSHLSSKVKR